MTFIFIRILYQVKHIILLLAICIMFNDVYSLHIAYILYCIFADVFQSAKYELWRIIVDYVTSCFAWKFNRLFNIKHIFFLHNTLEQLSNSEYCCVNFELFFQIKKKSNMATLKNRWQHLIIGSIRLATMLTFSL